MFWAIFWLGMTAALVYASYNLVVGLFLIFISLLGVDYNAERGLHFNPGGPVLLAVLVTMWAIFA